MKLPVALAAAGLSLTLASAPAEALVVVYSVPLSGAQSVPANTSTATGTATVTVDDVLHTVSVTMSWAGLTGGAASAAHIHCCVATNANGPVAIPFTGFPSAASGSYSNTFTGISVATITGIEAGQAYINVHNSGFPGGEIRGDIITVVPEPTTAALLLAGLGAVAMIGRRRNRRAG